MFAKGSLKKRFRPDLTQDDAARIAVEALYDAADDDSATGGPDTIRKLYPIVASVTSDGYRRYGDDEVEPVVTAIIADRSTSAGG